MNKKLLVTILILCNSIAYSAEPQLCFMDIENLLTTHNPKVRIVDEYDEAKIKNIKKYEDRVIAIKRLGRPFRTTQIKLSMEGTECLLALLIEYIKHGRKILRNDKEEKIAQKYIAHFFNGDLTLNNFRFTRMSVFIGSLNEVNFAYDPDAAIAQEQAASHE